MTTASRHFLVLSQLHHWTEEMPVTDGSNVPALQGCVLYNASGCCARLSAREVLAPRLAAAA